MEKVISADGTAIVFERSGDGPPVILVSGASCDRKANAALAALLAPDLTVLNYDRRGRGASGDTAPYAVAREVEDIAALVAAAGGSAALFGASSGAVLAMEAAASGLGITRLAMWEPPFQVDNDGPRRSREYVARLTELLSAGRRGDAAALFMKQVGLPDEFIAQTRTQPWWPAMEELAHTLAYDAAVMGDGLVPVERAASVMVPTMVIDGGASPPWADQAARAVSAVIPDVARRTLDGQDHNFAAEALAPVLKEFLG